MLIHHIETRSRFQAVCRLVETSSQSTCTTLCNQSTSAKWTHDIITFGLEDSQSGSIDIVLRNSEEDSDFAEVSIPLSIIPYDYRVNTKLMMNPLNKMNEMPKIFITIHLCTFGQLPFKAPKGNLLYHLKKAGKVTQKKRRPSSTLSKATSDNEIYYLSVIRDNPNYNFHRNSRRDSHSPDSSHRLYEANESLLH